MQIPKIIKTTIGSYIALCRDKKYRTDVPAYSYTHDIGLIDSFANELHFIIQAPFSPSVLEWKVCSATHGWGMVAHA